MEIQKRKAGCFNIYRKVNEINKKEEKNIKEVKQEEQTSYCPRLLANNFNLARFTANTI